MAHRRYNFRLYPSKSQELLLGKMFGSCRFVYNHFLRERINHWEQNKEAIRAKEIKGMNFFSTSKLLTELKAQEEYQWLREPANQSLNGSLRNLDTAFTNFFRGLKTGQKVGYPKFRKRSEKQTCQFFQGNQDTAIAIRGNRIKLIKFVGGIRFVQDRPINGRIVSATVSKVPSGKYFVSVLVDETIETLPKVDTSVGIDLGIKSFAFLSSGEEVQAPDYKKARKKVAKAQRHLSRKKKGSNRYNRQRIKVAREHEKVANIRKDFLNKLSTRLIRENQTICLENLNISGMMKNRRLARVVGEQGWYAFVSMLEYKAKWYGREIVKIDRFFPSSKTCSDCGTINQTLTLKDREWTCDACGVVHVRDWNAANNILSEGIRILQSAGSVDNRRGVDVRPRKRQTTKKRQSQ